MLRHWKHPNNKHAIYSCLNIGMETGNCNYSFNFYDFFFSFLKFVYTSSENNIFIDDINLDVNSGIDDLNAIGTSLLLDQAK